MYEQKNWRIRFVNETEEVVFGAEPRPSRDGHLLHVHEYYGVTGMQKGTRTFVLANVLTWTAEA